MVFVVMAFQDLLINCRAILTFYRALLMGCRALLMRCKALVMEHRAYLIAKRAKRALVKTFRDEWVMSHMKESCRTGGSHIIRE